MRPVMRYDEKVHSRPEKSYRLREEKSRQEAARKINSCSKIVKTRYNITMADQQCKKETILSPALPVQKVIPFNSRLLSKAVVELTISRKNIGIYPPGHIQITNSTDRAYCILQKRIRYKAAA